MKQFIILMCILFSAKAINAQQKYYTKNGTIKFEASVPSFEEIKAANNSVTAILNTKTHEIAALALMKAFRFKIALMEEHFNENYVESDEYPKATFDGKLGDFDFSKANSKAQKVELEGNLHLHNKSKKIKTITTISKKDNTISLTAEFKVKPEDFDIKIPSIVQEKIAKEIIVNVSFNLKEK
jgi:hypothetical protein